MMGPFPLLHEPVTCPPLQASLQFRAGQRTSKQGPGQPVRRALGWAGVGCGMLRRVLGGRKTCKLERATATHLILLHQPPRLPLAPPTGRANRDPAKKTDVWCAESQP
ncbi:hypothetical protein Cadr_000014711 [Camelus dromedarius]|uniref:Uncharacterized protein n=1 Tax=Camelus dromedarius TaxID=9838 RepID=A0A5N4DM67_CAMDR|nr:hypothetical protein Cadr_000014711 [Camelus dromedarius]